MNPSAPERFGADYFHSVYANTGCRPLDQHWWSMRLYAGIANRLLSQFGGRRMLEVGCGLGYILAALERKYETFGVDVSAYAIEAWRTKNAGG